jgi:hypothetical protein
VTGSPLERLLGAIDALDVEGAMALVAPDCHLLTVDGRRAEGAAGVRDLLAEFLSQLRSTVHRITAEWHPEDVWIAEVEADYELKDWLRLTALPRVFVLRDGEAGLTDVRVYGAHEQELRDHRSGESATVVGGHWIPPL